MKSTFFGRRALLILLIVFFLVPFVVRGARVSLQSMRNDVKDWLPKTFKETAEMDWFWRHFLGERFVLASWDGCSAEDEAYKLMLRKLEIEIPPSRSAPDDGEFAANSAGELESLPVAAERAMHSQRLERAYDFIGDRLCLFSTVDDHLNWGGHNEKWLLGAESLWYYLTPDGHLYEWDGGKTPLAAAAGKLWRSVFGGKVAAKHITDFGEVDGPWYYENPQRLNAQLFKTVTTGPGVLEGLTCEGGVLEDNPSEASRRLKGSLMGRDGKQTCLLLTLTEAGRKNLHRVIGRGALGKPRGRLFELAEECGITPSGLHLGGPPVDNVAIDEEGTITLVRLVSLCVLLGIGLAYACFRTISATFMVFFVGGISAVVSLALVGWCGSTLDAVLMSMPALVYVLGISGAVHIVNYYREAVEEGGFEGAPGKAVSHSWKPALLCNVTTALGLFSLITSDIVPIRKFGIYSGLAVMATLVLMFTYLPAALQLWPQKPRSQVQRQRDENPWYDRFLSRFWERLASGIIRHHYAVGAVCVLICIVVGWGSVRINTTVNMLKMFDGKAKIIGDYSWLENRIGELVPMEVVVKVPPRLMSRPAADRDANQASSSDEPYQLTFLDRMDIVDRIQKVVEEEFGEAGQGVAGQSLSAVTFAPVLPAAKGDTLTFARRGGTNARLEAHRSEFLKSEYLRMDEQDGCELWRISLRIAALKNVDYGDFVEELKCAVEPVIAAHRERERILRQLIESRDGKRYANAKVFVLGAPFGSTKKPPPTDDAGNGKSETKVAAVANPASPHTVDQTKIFAQTLKDLLTVARLRVDWHDPAADPVPPDLEQRLAKYDCVVLVGNGSVYNFEAIQKTAKLTVDVRDHLHKPGVATLAASDASQIGAIYTGVVPIVYKAQRALLESLIQSIFWSFVTITPLMMLVSRSFWAGLVAMLPNVLPVVVIFGAMGWLNIQVDIGSMMTASIALGVAVDDTIHYLTWYRWELDKGTERHAAILATYKRCATPTFQAAMISGLGLSIFAFSTFTPTQRFGYLMLAILFMGVVAELVFFPAILASPLGRVFKPRLAKTSGARHRATTGEGDDNVTPQGRIDSPHSLGTPELHGQHRDAPVH